MSYQSTRNVRRESRTIVGRFRGGKLVPVMAVPVRGNEGGMLSQSVTFELDPIAGRMITPITGELMAVFVPVQAIDAIKDPEASYPGMTEVLREKLLSGNPLFGLENEGEISKRCGVNPRSIGGVKKVSEMPRLAHNAAVNYLRVRKYHKAVQVPHSNSALTPAIIGQTVLDRLNGVLDPDDRINGTVNLELPTVNLPVKGVLFRNTPGQPAASTFRDGDGSTVVTTGSDQLLRNTSGTDIAIKSKGSGASSTADITALFSGVGAGGVSLTDFYNAEKMDKLTRVMDQMIRDNPEYGEEMVLRWAHGLSVDAGKLPFVIAEKRQIFGRNLVGATDKAGVQEDVIRSDMMMQIGFNVPIPRTELGGIIITFAVIKPDETLASQPHPFLSDVWGLDNFVADELALDPVPVTIRELDSGCTAPQEATVALYTGLNQLKATYVNYGLCRQLDPETVENKTAIWQLEIPMSVTPDNILYPADLSHYPFADQLVDVCTYTIASNVVVQTPMIIGPTPVEDVSIIDTADLFEEEA